mgnify:CR=1 FL=1
MLGSMLELSSTPTWRWFPVAIDAELTCRAATSTARASPRSRSLTMDGEELEFADRGFTPSCTPRSYRDVLAGRSYERRRAACGRRGARASDLPGTPSSCTRR